MKSRFTALGLTLKRRDSNEFHPSLKSKCVRSSSWMFLGEVALNHGLSCGSLDDGMPDFANTLVE